MFYQTVILNYAARYLAYLNMSMNKLARFRDRKVGYYYALLIDRRILSNQYWMTKCIAWDECDDIYLNFVDVDYSNFLCDKSGHVESFRKSKNTIVFSLSRTVFGSLIFKPNFTSEARIGSLADKKLLYLHHFNENNTFVFPAQHAKKIFNCYILSAVDVSLDESEGIVSYYYNKIKLVSLGYYREGLVYGKKLSENSVNGHRLRIDYSPARKTTKYIYKRGGSSRDDSTFVEITVDSTTGLIKLFRLVSDQMRGYPKANNKLYKFLGMNAPRKNWRFVYVQFFNDGTVNEAYRKPVRNIHLECRLSHGKYCSQAPASRAEIVRAHREFLNVKYENIALYMAKLAKLCCCMRA